MTRIERRQQRIRRLRTRFQAASQIPLTPNITSPEITSTPDTHHHIGKSQHDYENIGTFLLNNAGDPAIQVSSLLNVPPCTDANLAILRTFYPASRNISFLV